MISEKQNVARLSIADPVLVRRITPFGYPKKHRALFLCACGSEFEAAEEKIRSGNTRSCGCLQDANRRLSRPRHGHTGKNGYSRTWQSWSHMTNRCQNPNHHAYSIYGGAGISVCDRWRNSFEAFLADMGERPEGKSLDRWPNSDGNYEPENCRWATRKEQQRNLRTNRLYEFRGQKLTAGEIYEQAGPQLGYARFCVKLKQGVPADILIETAPLRRRKHAPYVLQSETSA